MKFKWVLLSLSFFIVLSSSITQDLPNFSSLDIFELEWVSDPQISPDGKTIAYIRNGMDIMNDQRTRRIWMVNIDGSNHQKLTSTDVNESSPRWSPDGQRLAFTASSDQGSEVFVYWMNTGKMARLSQLPASPSGISWSPDGNHLAFTMFVEGKELSLISSPKKPKGAKWAKAPRITTRFKHEADGSGKLKPGHKHLFILPSEGGTPRQLTNGNFNHASSPSWTTDSKHLLFSSNRNENYAYDFRNSEIYALEISTQKITALTDRNGPDHSLSVNGNSIAYLGFDDRVQTYQNTLLYTMNLDGSEKKVLSNNFDYGIESPTWAPNGKGIYFMYDDKGDTKIGHMDMSGKSTEVVDHVGGTSIGRPYSGGSFSIAGNGTLAYTSSSANHPAELAIIKKGDKAPTKVLSLNDDLLPYRNLGEVEEIWYKSSIDQIDIQGWLVYPPNYDAQQTYPLLVENHGGPIANYGDRFSPEFQLYATAGYVVFYPNPRGSTSYGEEFANLLYHNYPGEDYQDVMDGVDELIKQGVTTEDNLYVTGGSAGGIMTAWIIGKNNRFRSAAVVKPVMNWISKTLTADNYYGYANSRYPGQPWENVMDYWKFSPVSLVGNIQTPTLVMVGLNDLRTPLSEAKQLYHALKIRQIETALVEIPGASHFISRRPSQLITKVEHILAWFERYK
jgi:dipeptidyl aminopeptidase/acylaminoacyl peptidase